MNFKFKILVNEAQTHEFNLNERVKKYYFAVTVKTETGERDVPWDVAKSMYGLTERGLSKKYTFDMTSGIPVVSESKPADGWSYVYSGDFCSDVLEIGKLVAKGHSVTVAIGNTAYKYYLEIPNTLQEATFEELPDTVKNFRYCVQPETRDVTELQNMIQAYEGIPAKRSMARIYKYLVEEAVKNNKTRCVINKLDTTIGALYALKVNIEANRSYGWLNKVTKVNLLLNDAIYKYNASVELSPSRFYELVNYVATEIRYNLLQTYRGLALPNYSENTWYEYVSSKEFEKSRTSLMHNAEQLPEITDTEKDELSAMALAFGIVDDPREIGTVMTQRTTRHTKHGVSEECEWLITQKPSYSYNPKDGGQKLRKDPIKFEPSDLMSRVQYEQLRWYKQVLADTIKANKKIRSYAKRAAAFDEAMKDVLMEGYHVCPKCYKVYHESEGCGFCGYVKPNEDLLLNRYFDGTLVFNNDKD